MVCLVCISLKFLNYEGLCCKLDNWILQIFLFDKNFSIITNIFSKIQQNET
jgi:hypothetical protein